MDSFKTSGVVGEGSEMRCAKHDFFSPFEMLELHINCEICMLLHHAAMLIRGWESYTVSEYDRSQCNVVIGPLNMKQLGVLYNEKKLLHPKLNNAWYIDTEHMLVYFKDLPNDTLIWIHNEYDCDIETRVWDEPEVKTVTLEVGTDSELHTITMQVGAEKSEVNLNLFIGMSRKEAIESAEQLIHTLKTIPNENGRKVKFTP